LKGGELSDRGQATRTQGAIGGARSALVARLARIGAPRAALTRENARLRSEVGEAEQRLQTIVGSLAEAITIRDLDDSIVYANEAALSSMGFASLEALRAKPAQAIMDDYVVTGESGEEITMDELPSVRLLRGEQPQPLLIRAINRTTGDERWSILKATPLHDRAGRLEAALTIIEDVTATKRAELRGSFLARASEILASSLDYEETLRNVAWLAVPEIADWCAVDLIDERGLRQQVVAAHPEPAKLALAERLREYEPEQVDPRQGIGAVVRSGVSQLYPDIADEMLAQAAADAEHLRLLRELGMRSVLIVPMRAGARALGTMTLVSAESGRRFTDEDRQFAEHLAARAAVAVENARLYTQRSEIAATLQRSLLPTTLPRIDDWELATLYRPAEAGAHVEVGGDFYDAFETDGGWLVLIGDVTGKGVEAAAMTSLVRHGARFLGEDIHQPAQILARLDATLRQQSALSICSALCLLLDGDRVSFSSAGHPLPLLITDDGIRDVGATGPVLGAFANGEWPTHSLVLAVDELLLLYTDGVTDTVGRDERFGEQRLRRTMAECGPLAPAAALARLETALSSFQVGVQADDTAALALRPARVSARTRPEHDASRSRSRAAQPQPQPQRGARFDG
jgi:PAS domain S-box-containing protein